MVRNVQGQSTLRLDLRRLLQVDGFCQSLSELDRDFREVIDDAFLKEALSVNQMPSDVRHETFTCSIIQDVVVEG